MDVMEKLGILADAAKYDAACTSSGLERGEKGFAMGTSRAMGICHSFAGDGRCISLLKVLLTNYCSFDCAYCVNRRSNLTRRTAFEPKELAELTWQFYRRNYIEGLFLSSAVWKSPDYTCEQMIKVLELLRYRFRFGGYIHVKAIPGADPLLIDKLGRLADRISINIELPSQDSLHKLAPDKTKDMILKPMGQIRRQIAENARGRGRYGGIQAIGKQTGLAGKRRPAAAEGSIEAPVGESNGSGRRSIRRKDSLTVKNEDPGARAFAPAGQSTQLIVGASPETDWQILRLTESLYHTYHLKRVFYSAYIPVVAGENLPASETAPPLWREHRLYQADWLLRYYGFTAAELLNEERPQLHPYMDPKCQWALRHPDYFPLEVNRASFNELLRVPGIGVESAYRILRYRKVCPLRWEVLRDIGIVLKRARYFLLCGGRPFPSLSPDKNEFIAALMSPRERALFRQQERDVYQPSLFDGTAYTAADTGTFPAGGRFLSAVMPAGDDAFQRKRGSDGHDPWGMPPPLTEAQKEELVWTAVPVFA